jgi:hypothetical protein
MKNGRITVTTGLFSWSSHKVLPNPWLERTSTGWPLPRVAHVPSSGQPAAAAQLKR